jgi:tetratricopeptide (TPR) repeat protein
VNVNRRVLLVACVAFAAVAWLCERSLRADEPVQPEAQRLGMGRLMGGVLTGPFRPMLQTYLWIRSDILYGQGRYDEAQALFRTMATLYPDNLAARDYLGWQLAFNFKNEASDEEVAWVWARDGLDMLHDAGAARTLADWFLKQCGQNPLQTLRYTGPAWRRERRLRARARAWGARRYGAELERFDLGLKALEGRTKFYDQLRRMGHLTYGLYDDCVRTGTSDKFDDAKTLAEWMSTQLHVQGLPPPPGWKETYEERAWIFAELKARRVSARLVDVARYPVAMALFGLGAHGRDVELLKAAGLMVQGFEQSTDADCAKERALIGAWIDHVQDPSQPRPPLPFD